MGFSSALFTVLLCGLAASKEFSVVLDPDENFNVSWSFEGTTPTSYIEFKVSMLNYSYKLYSRHNNKTLR